MFLMRLMLLSHSDLKNVDTKKIDLNLSPEKKIVTELKSDTVGQIKNIAQEKSIQGEQQGDLKIEKKTSINSFDELINVCSEKKEMKLKYELEKNVNLVSFEKNRLEISFNDNLDKNFVKDLSLKLFEWTNQRWIISLSKIKGEITIKEKEKIDKNKLITNAKKTELYKKVLEKFPDASLIEVTEKKNDKN